MSLALAPLVLPRAGWAAGASTPPAELRAEWPEATSPHRQGEARMRFFGMHIYDITLWAPEPLKPAEAARRPLALAIDYRRSLSGSRIAERSLTEMRRAGPIDDATAARWLAAMTQVFPDVNDGDRITGVQWPGQAARFHTNGRFSGEVRDPRFAELFFGIWLAPWTSEPTLRQALLGSTG